MSKKRAECTTVKGHTYHTTLMFSTNWGGGEVMRCEHCGDEITLEYHSGKMLLIVVVVATILALVIKACIGG